MKTFATSRNNLSYPFLHLFQLQFQEGLWDITLVIGYPSLETVATHAVMFVRAFHSTTQVVVKMRLSRHGYPSDS